VKTEECVCVCVCVLYAVCIEFSLILQFLYLQMGRSAGFNLGGTYSSHRPQQQQQHAPSVSSSGVSFSSVNNQDLLHLHGSDIFPSSHSAYHSQARNEFLSHSVIGFEMTN
jgi:hypothetical protein